MRSVFIDLEGSTTLKGPYGNPNRETREYSRDIMEYKDTGRYIPIIFLLYSEVPGLGFPLKSLDTLHGFGELRSRVWE